MTQETPETDEEREQRTWQYCGVCSRPLEHEGEEWFHVRESDALSHVAVPVDQTDLASIVRRCDVCDDENVTHLWPAKNFTLFEGSQSMSIGAWALCPICVGYANRGRPSALVTRAMEALRHKQKLTHISRRLVAHTYDRLFENVTAPPQEIQR